MSKSSATIIQITVTTTQISGVKKSRWYSSQSDNLFQVVELHSDIGGGIGLRVGLDERSYSTPGPISTVMGDRLRAGKLPRFVTSHSGQLSLLPSAGQKNDTGQSAVTLCGWGVKAGMVHIPLVDERVGGR